MNSFDVRIGDDWDKSEAIINCESPTLPRIGERIEIDSRSCRVIDVSHHGIETPGGHFATILAKPEAGSAGRRPTPREIGVDGWPTGN